MTIVKNHSLQHRGTLYHWMGYDYEIHSCETEYLLSLWTLSMKMGIDLEETSVDVTETASDLWIWDDVFCLFCIGWSVVVCVGGASSPLSVFAWCTCRGVARGRRGRDWPLVGSPDSKNEVRTEASSWSRNILENSVDLKSTYKADLRFPRCQKRTSEVGIQ